MKTLTVGEVRNILAYMPDDAECFIALSKDRIVSVEIESLPSHGKSLRLCDCDEDDGESCKHCDDSTDFQVFFRTE